MKFIKKIICSLLMLTIMASFSQCSSTQKLQDKAPMDFGEAYCESWAAGVKGGGSGINIFIPVRTDIEEKVELDSVYFRGKAAKLVTKPQNQHLYIGYFSSKSNQKEDIILSIDMKEEAKNKLPEIEPEIPFELNGDECVVSYKKGDKTLYYKITNVKEKRSLNYPMAPKNNP